MCSDTDAFRAQIMFVTKRKIWTAVASTLTSVLAHLLVALHCHDIINVVGRKVAKIENKFFIPNTFV